MTGSNLNLRFFVIMIETQNLKLVVETEASAKFD
jgi:hypothetical protein